MVVVVVMYVYWCVSSTRASIRGWKQQRYVVVVVVVDVGACGGGCGCGCDLSSNAEFLALSWVPPPKMPMIVVYIEPPINHCSCYHYYCDYYIPHSLMISNPSKMISPRLVVFVSLSWEYVHGHGIMRSLESDRFIPCSDNDAWRPLKTFGGFGRGWSRLWWKVGKLRRSTKYRLPVSICIHCRLIDMLMR